MPKLKKNKKKTKMFPGCTEFNIHVHALKQQMVQLIPLSLMGKCSTEDGDGSEGVSAPESLLFPMLLSTQDSSNDIGWKSAEDSSMNKPAARIPSITAPSHR